MTDTSYIDAITNIYSDLVNALAQLEMAEEYVKRYPGARYSVPFHNKLRQNINNCIVMLDDRFDRG